MRIEIKRNANGDHVITTDDHVVTVYDAPTARALVRSNRCHRDRFPDEGTPYVDRRDEEGIRTNERILYEILREDVPALEGLAQIDAIPPIGILVLYRCDSWGDPISLSEHDDRCRRMTAWLTAYEGRLLSCTVRGARDHEVEGVFVRRGVDFIPLRASNYSAQIVEHVEETIRRALDAQSREW